MWNQAYILNLVKKSTLVILLEYHNIKTFFKKATFQIRLKKFLRLKKLKTLFIRHMLLVILTANKLLERFTIKELQQTNQKGFWVEKVIKYMLNGKAMIVLLTVGLINRHSRNQLIFSRSKIFGRKSKSWITIV